MTIFKLLLDPGHAAMWPRRGVGGFEESANNLLLACAMKSYAEVNYHIQADLTRTSTAPLDSRSEAADLAARARMSKGYDLFYSVHTDAAGASVTGATAYGDINSRNADHILFRKLVDAISEATGFTHNGVRYRSLESDWSIYNQPMPGKSNYYMVLREGEAKVAVLMEHGFHTNHQEAKVLADPNTHRRIAKNVIDTIAAHYSIPRKHEHTPEEFIKRLAPLAVADFKKSGILPSVTIAQAMVESANGNSELARNAQNYFGIKASAPWTGEKYTKTTSEYVNGKYITVSAAFRKYPNLKESVADHGSFFTSTDFRKQLYKDVIGQKDWRKAVQALTGTYATSPTYAATLTDRIERYKLYEYDKEPEVVKPKPRHIGVYAKNSADMGSALRVVSQVRDAVWIDPSRVNKALYSDILQIGGEKEALSTIHISGSDRYETDRLVSEWIQQNK